ncbi:hypothetical protein N7468_006980 [Penicillium chermesinum]|uniref:Uncharacterized protein n=1 Tax=Penicillium chermesinum TaxID=63820 RepID=A0A9W9TLR1_9EURO|nr:uncharacterized protein N7468_006980 [Penicillium chermesinum]KAJ5225755.1 hypothetical protein N7468_006980 [Penicillium chermesinum]
MANQRPDFLRSQPLTLPPRTKQATRPRRSELMLHGHRLSLTLLFAPFRPQPLLGPQGLYEMGEVTMGFPYPSLRTMKMYEAQEIHCIGRFDPSLSCKFAAFA